MPDTDMVDGFRELFPEIIAKLDKVGTSVNGMRDQISRMFNSKPSMPSEDYEDDTLAGCSAHYISADAMAIFSTFVKKDTEWREDPPYGLNYGKAVYNLVNANLEEQGRHYGGNNPDQSSEFAYFVLMLDILTANRRDDDANFLRGADIIRTSGLASNGYSLDARRSHVASIVTNSKERARVEELIARQARMVSRVRGKACDWIR